MTEEYKCKDCKWLTGKKNIRGIECMNPVLQEKWNGAKNLWMGELRKDTARYKQRNAPACKKFEAKESKPMSRYIDADAIKDKAWKAESEACFYALEDVVSVTDIDEAPSIDIVRCKDCRHSEESLVSGSVYCNEMDRAISENGFCHKGERKESE